MSSVHVPNVCTELVLALHLCIKLVLVHYLCIKLESNTVSVHQLLYLGHVAKSWQICLVHCTVLSPSYSAYIYFSFTLIYSILEYCICFFIISLKDDFHNTLQETFTYIFVRNLVKT